MQQWLTNCIPLESYSQRKPVKPVFWLPVNEELTGELEPLPDRPARHVVVDARP
jgi:hypothetical protein